MAAPGGATGVTTLTDGIGLTAAAGNDVPQLEQKVASSLLSAPHETHLFTNIFLPPSLHVV